MELSRWWRHLVWTRGKLARDFPVQALDEIERAITASESTHGGELRFAVEGALEPQEVWAGRTPRERALEVFASLGVWDTEANNGVLIYLLLADRDVEIVADRGYNGRVRPQEWTAVCEAMEQRLRAGQYLSGVLEGVHAAGALMARHFPAGPGGREDQLPNRPAVL